MTISYCELSAFMCTISDKKKTPKKDCLSKNYSNGLLTYTHKDNFSMKTELQVYQYACVHSGISKKISQKGQPL